MTISTTASSITLNGDGSNKTWNYSFLIPLASDAQVSTKVAGITTILDPSVYSISGIGNPVGGSVTYPLSGSALANGSTITITRVLPLTQTTELTSQGDFDPAVVESALDYITMLVQDINTQVGGLDAATIAASAAEVSAAVASFNDEYLGAFAANPTGTHAGQLYFNTTSNEMRAYNGSVWQVTYNPGTGAVNSFNGRTGAVLPASGDYTIAQITGAAAVAASGAYSDLTGKPALATVATSGLYSDLSGRPVLAAVASSGVYTDLSGRPSLGTAATLNVGTTANSVVQLTAAAKLPAVDGSLLTNLPASGVPVDSYGSVGTFVFGSAIPGSGVVTWSYGATLSGTYLSPSDTTSNAGTSLPGTWRCMGIMSASTTTVWQRIA